MILRWLEGVKWKVWLGVVAALLACVPLAYCGGKSDGREAERKAQLKAQIAEERKAREDDAEAAERRAANKVENDAKDKARQEAIDNAPDDETDAAGRALACERLRAAGIDTPASCG